MPINERTHKVIQVVIPLDTYVWLKERAERSGRSLSRLVGLWLEEEKTAHAGEKQRLRSVER